MSPIYLYSGSSGRLKSFFYKRKITCFLYVSFKICKYNLLRRTLLVGIVKLSQKSVLQKRRPPVGHRSPTTTHPPTGRSSTDPSTTNNRPPNHRPPKSTTDPPTSTSLTHRPPTTNLLIHDSSYNGPPTLWFTKLILTESPLDQFFR